MKNNSKINNNKHKISIKKTTFFYIIGLIILIYFVYAIIGLIRHPTDVFMIENGSLSDEESEVRLCNKR